MTDFAGAKRKKTKSSDPDSLPTLPRHWRWAVLSDLASPEPDSITDGPFGSNLKTSHYTDAGPRVIRLQNIGDGVFRDEYAHISNSHFDALKRHEVCTGDVVIAALGETLPRACVIPSWVGSAIVKADCPRFRPNPEAALAQYVAYALNSPDVRKRTSEIIHGVGRPRLNLSEIRGIWIPVAPPHEQERIVGKIDELFSDLDAGVAALERAKVNLRRYRAAVLKAAVEGKLTEEWRAEHPDVEPASKLLERILAERRQKWEADQLAKFAAAGKQPPKNWQAKYLDPTPPTVKGLPSLPEGWCWATLDEIADVQSGQTPTGIAESTARTGDIPWFKVGDMNHEDNSLFMRTAKDWISFAEAARLGLHVRPAGTIVFPKRGGAIATNKKRILAQPAAYDLNTMGLIPNRSVADYLWHWFASIDLAALSDGSNVPQINHKDIEPLAAPLPPEEEQQAIVSLVAERLSQIAAAEVIISHGLVRAGRLRQSVLTEAFKGRLAV